MGEGSPPLAREAPPSRPYPYLSGLSAHRVIDLIALQVAPAATATAIAYSHLDSDWRATLIFFSFFGVSMLLRRGEHPSHLIPFAWATLYALAPPIAALVAWVVTGVGALLTHLQLGLGEAGLPDSHRLVELGNEELVLIGRTHFAGVGHAKGLHRQGDWRRQRGVGLARHGELILACDCPKGNFRLSLCPLQSYQ